MSSSLILIGVVLGVVFVLEAWTLLAAWLNCKRADNQKALADLAEVFSGDIERRARHGRNPDWLHYLEEGERPFKLRIDRLRNFSAVALAIGMGGTIVSLLVNPGALISLAGILLGVLVYLVIALWLIRRSESQFLKEFRSWRQHLQAVSQDYEPRDAFSEALLKGMQPVRDTLKEEIVGIFATAVPGFPKAVAELGGNLERLSRIVEKQGSVIEAAVADLQGTASAMEQLAPAAQVLAGASTALGELPESLSSTLEESRQSWLQQLRREEGVHVKEILSFHRELEERSQARERQMVGLVLDLQQTMAEMREEIGRTPSLLSETIAELSRQLGIEFGQHARDSNNELAAHLKEQQEMLLLRQERREQELRNNIGLIVKELFDQVSGTIEKQIVDKLLVAGDALSHAAQHLEEASDSWYRTQEKTLQHRGDAADQIHDSSQLIAATGGQLRTMTGSLEATTNHPDQVVEVHHD